MHRYTQADDGKQARDALAAIPMHTTLYDLIGAMHAEAGSHANEMIVAAVAHAFKTYHIACLGDFAGCRMILDEQETSCSAVA